LGVWENEIRKHQPDNIDVEWRVLNYEAVAGIQRFDWATDTMWIYEGTFEELKKWKPDIIIADEAHRLKRPTTKRSRKLYSLGRVAPSKLILTGTPITKNHIDLFGQFKFLDDSIFGTNWGKFKNEYGLWGGYMGYKLLRPRNVKQLRKKIKPITFRVRKEQCFDLPDYVHEIVPVYLDRSRPLYDEMADQAIVELKSGELVEAPIVLVRLLRLAQMSGGWIRGEGDYSRVGTEKAAQYKRVLGEMRENEVDKVVVFARFKRELADAAKLSRSLGYRVRLLHGGVPRHKRDLRILEFHESEEPMVFIAQTETGAESIDLTCAHTCVFYSQSQDWGKFEQACSRLHRHGQKNKVTYYHLLARHTVDEATYIANKGKESLAKFVINHPDLLK
jgi:SNF2 family DNA or RNA helicase